MQDKEYARREIERKIAFHSDAIISLKTEWNTLSPISRLPTELLAEIFIHHARDTIDKNRKGPSYIYAARYAGVDKPYAWISVTQICRHWRAIALSCPRLWNHIYVTNLQWMTTIVPRAMKAPLFLEVDTTSRCWENHLQAVQTTIEEMDRVEELKFTMHTDVFRQLDGNFSQPAKALRTLSMRLYGRDEYGFQQYPPAFLQIAHPRLERVSLINIPGLQWSTALFSSTITELSVHQTSQISGSTLSAMLSALQAMPQLCVLDISNFVPQDTALPVVGGAYNVTLPHLRTLKLFGDRLSPATCATLLNRLSIPTLRRLALGCVSIDRAEELVAPLSANLQETDTVSALAIDMDRYHLAFSAWTTQSPVNGSVSDIFNCPADISLLFSGGDVPSVGVGLLLDLCRVLPLVGVKAFRLRCPFHVTEEHARALLEPLRNATHVDIFGYPHSQISRALQLPTSTNDKDPNPFIMPRLQTLHFNQSSFVPDEQPPGYEITREDTFGPLLHCLEKRKEEGAAISRLVMNYCTVQSWEDRKALEDCVDRPELYCLDIFDDRSEEEEEDRLIHCANSLWQLSATLLPSRLTQTGVIGIVICDAQVTCRIAVLDISFISDSYGVCRPTVDDSGAFHPFFPSCIHRLWIIDKVLWLAKLWYRKFS